MTSLFISAAVTHIDPVFFQLFPNATSITVAENNESYSSYNGMVFSKDLTSLHLVPEGLEGNAVLPASLATVPACVFSRCTKLSAIVATAYAGSAATSAFTTQDGILYTNDKTTLIAAPAGIGASATIAPECTTIAAGAFWGSANLKTIVSNAVVEDIITAQSSNAQADDAAAAVPAFSSEIIANATVVLNVSDDNRDTAKQAWEAAGFAAFAEAAQPGSIAGPEAGQSGLAFTLQDDNTLAAWWSGSDTAPTTMEIPETAELNGVTYAVASIAANGFQNQSALEEVLLPSGLTALGEAAFAGSGLTQLSIPGSVVTIGEGAFADCAALAAVELHEGTRTIADRAFSGTTIESITLPKSIQSIGASAFAECQNLQTVLTLGSISEVAATALAGCSGVSVYVPLRADEDYSWSLGAPAAGNHLMPYGVQVTPGPLALTEGEEADLFQDGYVEAPGNIEVTYAYKQPVSVADGMVTAKQQGTTPVTASLSLGDIQLAASSTPVTVARAAAPASAEDGIMPTAAGGYDPSTRLPIKIVFDAQDGTLPSALNGEFYNRVPGGTFTVPADTPTPADSTYDFAYWILQGYGPIQPGETIDITESFASEYATSGGYLYIKAHYTSGLKVVLDPNGGYQPYATEFNEATNGYPVVQGSRYPAAGKNGYSYIPIPIRPGYTFEGYYLNGVNWYQSFQNRPGDVLRNYSGDNLPSGNTTHTLVAQWTRNTSIPLFSLNADGGEQGVSRLIATVYGSYYPVAPGNAIPCSSFEDHSYLPIPTKDGYKFLGYFADGKESPVFAAGTSLEAGGREVLVCSAGYESVTNLTLTARWAVDDQCLILDPGEGAYQPVATKIYEHDNYRLPIAVGDAMPVDGKPGYSRIPIPVKPGYTFEAYVCTGTGYRLSEGTGGGFLYDVNGNISIAIEQCLRYVAQWTKNDKAPKVTLNPNGGTQELATEVYLLNTSGDNNYPVVVGDMFPVRGMPGFSYVPMPVKEGGLFTGYISSSGTAFAPGSYPDGEGYILRTVDSSLTTIDSIQGVWSAQYSTDLWKLSYDCAIPGFYVQGNLSESYSYGVGDRTLPTPTDGVTSGQSGNWKFAGWYDNPDYEGSAYTELPLYAAGDKKFYAKWTATATLRNDPTGASDAESYDTSVDLVYGKAFPKVEVPDFPYDQNYYGYTFRGYSNFNPNDIAIDGSSKPKLFADENGESVGRIIDMTNASEVFYAYWSVRSDLNFAKEDAIPGSVTAIFVLLGAPAGIAFDDAELNANAVEYALYRDFSDENIIGNQPDWMPKCNGYTFDGFSFFGSQSILIDKNGFPSGRFIAKADPKLQLQARWIADKFKITYETYDGAAIINSGQVDSYTYGVGATLPTDVSSGVISTGTSYSDSTMFFGWSETPLSSSGNKWDYLKFVTEIPTTATGDKTFYAIVGQEWNFDYRGGSGNFETFRRIVTRNGSATTNVTTAPFPRYQDLSTLVAPKEGWEFAGMIYTTSSGSLNSIVCKDGSHSNTISPYNKKETAYAFWVKDVALDANGGEAGSVATVKASYGHPLGYGSTKAATSSSSAQEIRTILPPTNKPSANEGWKPSNGSRPFLGYFTSPTRGQGQMVIDAEGNPTDVAYTFDQNTVYAQWGDVVNGSYTVKYYQQNLTGSGYTEVVADRITSAAEVGTTVTAPTKSYTGFTLNTSKSKTSGTITTDSTLELTRYFDRNTYTVTWKSQDGATTLETDTGVRYGAQPTFNGTQPTKASTAQYSYTFVGWNTSTNAESGTAHASLPAVSANVTYHAAFSKQTQSYTATFNTDGGTPTPATQTKAYGSTFTKPTTNPSKNGYTFETWRTGSKTGPVYDFSTKVTGNLTLYASYTANASAFEFYIDGAKRSDLTISGVTDQSTAGKSLPVPTQSGYTFDGWYTDAACTQSASALPATFPAGGKSYYGTWVANGANYKVEHYQQNTTGTGYTLADTDTKAAKVGDTVTAVPKTYTGFTENASHANRVPSGAVPATGTLTLKLYYDRDTYTVTYKVNGMVNGERDTVRYGAEVVVRSLSSTTGYYYSPWTPTSDSNVSISDGTFIMPANNVILISTSRLITYTITYKANYSGGAADQQVSLTYTQAHSIKAGDTFTRTAYDLVKWNTRPDGSGDDYEFDQSVSRLTATDGANIDLYAQWQKKTHTVTWHANNGHFGSTTSDTVRTTPNVEHSATVASYTPQPTRDEYRFVGWAKSSTATSALSFPQTITAATDFYAVWKKTYTIAFDPNGGNWDGSTAVNSKTYDEGAAVAKPADPVQAGKLFAGWSEARGGTAVEPVATATKNVTYYALWNDATASVVVNHYQQNETGADYTLRYRTTPTATVGSTYTAQAGTYPGFHENTSHSSRVPSGIVPASGTLELALYYDRNTHSVTYQFSGIKPASATVPVDNTAHRYGATVTVKNPTTVAGWSFGGWSVKQGGVTLSSDSFQMGDANVVLEGTWTAQASTITFQTNGGSAVAPRTGVTDQAITNRAMPTTTWDGHTFEGWFANASLTGDPVTQLPAAFPAGGATYYAKWSVKTYDVKWNPNGGSWAEGGSAAKITPVTHGQNVTAITETPNAPENHAFGGWAASKADADAKVAVTFPVQNAGEPTVKEYFAIWNKDAVVYTVKYLDADGNQLRAAKSGSGEVDAQVTETAPTITGYTVAGDTTKTITLKADATQNVIVFRYAAKTTAVTFNGHGGTGGMVSKSATFTYAQPLPTIENADGMTMPAGKKLDGWFSAATGGTKYYEADGSVATSAPTTDGKWVGTGGSVPTSMTLHAQWSAKSYTITFSAGEGSGNMDGLVVTYGDGTVFPTCTFTAPENTQFAGWKVQGAVHAAGAAADAFDVADGMTLVAEAQWARNGYTVTFDANGGTFGASSTVSQVYAPGAAITVPVPARTGYLFDGWMVDGVHVDEVDATATRDVTYVAAWDQPSFLVTLTGGAAGAKYAGTYQGGLPSFANADAAASHKDEADYRFYNEELQVVQQWVQYGKAGQTLPKVLDLYKLPGASAPNVWGSTSAAPGAGNWTGGMALGGTEGGAGDEHFVTLYADGAGATLYAQFTPTIDVTVPTVVDMSLNVSGDAVSVSAASGGAATKFVSRSAGDVVVSGISEGATAGGSLAVQQGDYIANAVKILCADDGSEGLRDIMLTVAQAGQEGGAGEAALAFNLLSRGPASAAGASIEVPAGQVIEVEYSLAGVDAAKVTPSEPLKIANLIYQISIKE